MKQDKKKPTASQVDTSMLMTGEEMHNLDAVCAGLVDATESARRADAELSPDVPDVETYPAQSLQELHINKKLIGEMRTSLMATYRSGDTYRRNKLLTHWLCFVYQGAIPLLQKKYQIATALGKHDAAKKLGDAFAAIPPRDKIDHPNGLADIESEARHLADEITPDGFCFDIRNAVMLDAEATKKINAANASQTPTHGDLPNGFMDDLTPEHNKKDALEYMARLVCYVWCMIPTHSSKSKAMDYVFESAKDGSRLFSNCSRARGLSKSYGYNPSTIQLEAAKLHSKLTTWRTKSGMDWPDNWRDMVRKSQTEEDNQSKAEKRRTNRKKSR